MIAMYKYYGHLSDPITQNLFCPHALDVCVCVCVFFFWQLPDSACIWSHFMIFSELKSQFRFFSCSSLSDVVHECRPKCEEQISESCEVYTRRALRCCGLSSVFTFISVYLCRADVWNVRMTPWEFTTMLDSSICLTVYLTTDTLLFITY